MMECFDKMWSVEKGMSNNFNIFDVRTPRMKLKRQTFMTLKDEPNRLVGAQYTTGEEQENSSRRNEEAKEETIPSSGCV